MSFYPVALEVRGRRCVVIGGGSVGERKARALVEAGAKVCVVAPTITESLQELVRAGHVEHLPAAFAPEHLDGAFLAIAATNDTRVNDTAAAAARTRGALVNRVDDAECGDFVTMATVRRGDLLLALTTGGAGPALTARLRGELEARFGSEWGDYVALLGEMREQVKRQYPEEKERARVLRRLAAADSIRAKLAAGDAAGAREEALACVS